MERRFRGAAALTRFGMGEEREAQDTAFGHSAGLAARHTQVWLSPQRLKGVRRQVDADQFFFTKQGTEWHEIFNRLAYLLALVVLLTAK
ncbi:hypothetical protein GCM10022631_10500 [Deinococcus rubellus]